MIRATQPVAPSSYPANPPIKRTSQERIIAMLRGLLLSVFALTFASVSLADTAAEIRYKREECDRVCVHEIMLRQDRFPCYAKCEKQMEKELKTATKVVIPKYVERPGDCPITRKKDVEEIFGIQVQKVIADDERWMSCDFVSDDLIVRITNSVGAPIITGRDPHTQGSKALDQSAVSKLGEAARRQIDIWENHRKQTAGKVRI
jgi:hypothetical protein